MSSDSSTAHRLALAHLTVLEVAPPALFDLAARAGFDAVGLRVHPAAPGTPEYPLDARRAVEWRRARQQAGVAVHDIEMVPLAATTDVTRLAPMLDWGAELGATRLNVCGDDPDPARLADTYATLCDLAAPRGLTVEMEFMRWRAVGTLGQALAVVGRAARPNGRVLLDLLHLHRSGGDAQALRAAPPQWLGSVQLSDAPRADPGNDGIVAEAREARLFPGEGGLPLRDLLDALPTGLPMGVEVPTARTWPGLSDLERASRAAQAARRLLQRPSAVG
ncbi:MAG: sugar phosphate isomerase/epimerase family protein [Rubrivivax sp.]|jgi:sugar phosphate isomerase/epimerase